MSKSTEVTTSTLTRTLLLQGRIVHVDGIPFRLVQDAVAESHPANIELIGDHKLVCNQLETSDVKPDQADAEFK
ncbi:hypothetical protein [Pseudaeromonas pectinilytica]